MLGDPHGRTLTFAQYQRSAEAAAAGLSARGIISGDCVAWQLPTTLEGAVLCGALARLGVLQCPIIQAFRENEIDFIVGQSRPKLLVAARDWRGVDCGGISESVAARHGCDLVLCDVGGVGNGELKLPLAESSSLAPFQPRHGPQARWIFYTSGTTSAPKGARHPDRSVIAAGRALRLGIGLQSDDVFPMAFPIAHIGGPSFLAAQCQVGAKVVLIDVFDPASSPQIMAEQGATVLGSGLPFFNAYLAAQTEVGERRLFPRLRICAAGGAPLPPDMHQRLRETLGGSGVANAYGLTEFPVATTPDVTDSDEALAYAVGRPAPGVVIRIVGPDGTDVPPGEDGEVRLDGPQKLLGYVDATLDGAAFDDRGYFRTGDVGALDEHGRLRLSGRIKDIIIRNGENISATELENVLVRHPGVADVAIVSLPDERTGERCCAVIVPTLDRPPLRLADLVTFCRDAGLAPYKCPEQLEVVGDLPRNSLGKLLKDEIRRGITRSGAGPR